MYKLRASQATTAKYATKARDSGIGLVDDKENENVTAGFVAARGEVVEGTAVKNAEQNRSLERNQSVTAGASGVEDNKKKEEQESNDSEAASSPAAASVSLTHTATPEQDAVPPGTALSSLSNDSDVVGFLPRSVASRRRVAIGSSSLARAAVTTTSTEQVGRQSEATDAAEQSSRNLSDAVNEDALVGTTTTVPTAQEEPRGGSTFDHLGDTQDYSLPEPDTLDDEEGAAGSVGDGAAPTSTQGRCLDSPGADAVSMQQDAQNSASSTTAATATAAATSSTTTATISSAIGFATNRPAAAAARTAPATSSQLQASPARVLSTTSARSTTAFGLGFGKPQASTGLSLFAVPSRRRPAPPPRPPAQGLADSSASASANAQAGPGPATLAARARQQQQQQQQRQQRQPSPPPRSSGAGQRQQILLDDSTEEEEDSDDEGPTTQSSQASRSGPGGAAAPSARGSFFSAQGQFVKQAAAQANRRKQERAGQHCSAIPANLPFVLEPYPADRPELGDNDAISNGSLVIEKKSKIISVVLRLSMKGTSNMFDNPDDVRATLRKLAQVGFCFGKNQLRWPAQDLIVLTYIQIESALISVNDWHAEDEALIPINHQGWTYSAARHACDAHLFITPTAAGVNIRDWSSRYNGLVDADEFFDIPESASLGILYELADSRSVSRLMVRTVSQLRRALDLSARGDDDQINDASLDLLINDLIAAEKSRLRRKKFASLGAKGGPPSLTQAKNRNTSLIGRYRGVNQSNKQDLDRALRRNRRSNASARGPPGSGTPTGTQKAPEKPRERYLSCEECGKTFPKPVELKRHMAVHEDKDYPCPATGCKRVYGNPHSMTAHYKEVHLQADLGVRWACDICNDELETRSVLRTHMRLKHKNTDPIPTAEDQMRALGVLINYDPPSQKAIIELSEQKRMLEPESGSDSSDEDECATTSTAGHAAKRNKKQRSATPPKKRRVSLKDSGAALKREKSHSSAPLSDAGTSQAQSENNGIVSNEFVTTSDEEEAELWMAGHQDELA